MTLRNWEQGLKTDKNNDDFFLNTMWPRTISSLANVDDLEDISDSDLINIDDDEWWLKGLYLQVSDMEIVIGGINSRNQVVEDRFYFSDSNQCDLESAGDTETVDKNDSQCGYDDIDGGSENDNLVGSDEESDMEYIDDVEVLLMFKFLMMMMMISTMMMNSKKQTMEVLLLLVSMRWIKIEPSPFLWLHVPYKH